LSARNRQKGAMKMKMKIFNGKTISKAKEENNQRA
jgi:hypothetical protein